MRAYTKKEIENSLNNLDDKLCELEQYRTDVSVQCIYDPDLELLKNALQEAESLFSEKRKERLSQFESEYIRILKHGNATNPSTQKSLDLFCQKIYDGELHKSDTWHIRNVLIPIVLHIYKGNRIALQRILTETLLSEYRYPNKQSLSIKEFLQDWLAQWITTDWLYPKD